MNNEFKLSKQCVGCFMVMLQQAILEQRDLTKDFLELIFIDIGEGVLEVKNPPLKMEIENKEETIIV